VGVANERGATEPPCPYRAEVLSRTPPKGGGARADGSHAGFRFCEVGALNTHYAEEDGIFMSEVPL
jgi:hypothetical protein